MGSIVKCVDQVRNAENVNISLKMSMEDAYSHALKQRG